MATPINTDIIFHIIVIFVSLMSITLSSIVINWINNRKVRAKQQSLDAGTNVSAIMLASSIIAIIVSILKLTCSLNPDGTACKIIEAIDGVFVSR